MADAPFRITQATLDVLEVLLVADEEVYGRQIVVATEHKSGAVNVILRRLEHYGWVNARWETETERPTGPRRRFYRLAPALATAVHGILVDRGRISEPQGPTSLLVGSSSRNERHRLIIHWDICYEYHPNSSSLAEHFDDDALMTNPEGTRAISYWLAPGEYEEAQHTSRPTGFVPVMRVDLDPGTGAGAARWFPGRVNEVAAEEEGYRPQGFRSWGSNSTMTIVPGSIARVSYATARRLALEYADTGRQPTGVRWVG